jgi:hypothetical protein
LGPERELSQIFDRKLNENADCPVSGGQRLPLLQAGVKVGKSFSSSSEVRQK